MQLYTELNYSRCAVAMGQVTFL